MSDEKRLEILYAHYKSIVERNRNNVRSRYRYLFYILVVVSLVLLEVFFPKDGQSLISEFLAGALNISSKTDFQIVETGLLFVLMLLIVRYLQIAITVERQYPHIHYLEKQLSDLFGDKVFTFESSYYLGNYPKYLNVSDILYKWIIPFIFILVVGLKIGKQLSIHLAMLDPDPKPIPGFNIAVAVAVVIFVGLYWWFLIKQNILGKIVQCIRKKVMQRIPNKIKQLTSKITQKIQNILNKIKQCADNGSQQAEKQTTAVAEDIP